MILRSVRQKCLIGTLDPDSVAPESKPDSPFALDTKEWRAFKLIAKQTVCTSTVKFTFELPAGKKLVSCFVTRSSSFQIG
jgi:hypothetical protein